MAEFSNELDSASELLQGLCIDQNTSQSQEASHQAELQSDVLDEDKVRYNDLVKKGKELGRRGYLERALELFEKAYQIFASEKLFRKIEKAKVLRAQNLVAAEAALSGPGQPGGVYPLPTSCSKPFPSSQEGMALPKGLGHSMPLSENNMNARQKIQAKIDSERFIKPKPQDTKRFQPRQFAKTPIQTTPEEFFALNEQNVAEELEKDFASLHIENGNLQEPPSPEIGSGDGPERDSLSQCPSGEHVSAAIHIKKCACLISKEERERYKACLNSARRLEMEGKIEAAILRYMDGLDLMDSEPELHRKIVELGDQMYLHL